MAASVVFAHLLLLLGSYCGDAGFISWEDFRVEKFTGRSSMDDGSDVGGGVMVVSKRGKGHFATVQAAVDSVPHGNKQRVRILVLPGVYREKVLIPHSKPYISLIGRESSRTVISWNSTASDRDEGGGMIGTLASSSFAVESDYFCATGITFENTSPSAPPGANGMQAVALRVTGDKAMFFLCRILGSQDTLFDHTGRHFFYRCYIRGSIDFIFGSARSLYQECRLDAASNTYGAIAASQRNSASEDSGFSFVRCRLTGAGKMYLGRAWGSYSTVVYSLCKMQGIIVPEGWSDWGDPSRRRTALFGEFNCTGAGANTSGRASWARSLTYHQARPFLNRTYIDGPHWLRL